MEVLKTALNTLGGAVVTWINAAISMHSLNEGIAVLVGSLTAVYLICQINKSIKKKRK